MEITKTDGVKDKDDRLQDIDTVLVEEGNNYYSDVFTPGETKEQLRIGHEVAGSAGGNFKIVHYTHSSTSTGNYSFTGAGFKPKFVEIIGYVAGWGIDFVDGYGYFDETNTYSKIVIESGSAITGLWANNGIIDFFTAAQHNNRKQFTLVSFDSDGMTVNFSISAGTMNFIVKYYG